MIGLGCQLLQVPHFKVLAGRDQTELTWYEKCTIYYNIYKGFPDTGLCFPFHKADAAAWKLRLVMVKKLHHQIQPNTWANWQRDRKYLTIFIENSLSLEW